MIEPEIAFADLSDDASLAEALLKHVFKTLLAERPVDMAFFEERIEKGIIAEAAGHRRFRVRAHGLRRGGVGPRALEGEVRVSCEVGHGPAVRARALPHREAREEAGDRDELPEGHQGVLHAAERRREDRCRDGRARAWNRRNRWRQPASRSGSQCSTHG
jgi:hypothetical protein